MMEIPADSTLEGVIQITLLRLLVTETGAKEENPADLTHPDNVYPLKTIAPQSTSVTGGAQFGHIGSCKTEVHLGLMCTYCQLTTNGT